MMPKTIHLTYHWDDPPLWVKRNVAEFVAMHPGWEVRFWTDLPIGMPQAIHDALAWAPTRRFQSDLVRYWILQQYGGIYVDVDCRP